MSKKYTTAELWDYVAECVRLLYWSYFKPFTFKHWLKDIHPELGVSDNPFTKRYEFPTNPRLRRYAQQSWWLIFTLWTISLILLELLTFFTGKPVNWLSTGFSVLIYGTGLWLVGYRFPILPLVPILGGIIPIATVGIIIDEVLGEQQTLASLIAYAMGFGMIASPIGGRSNLTSKYVIFYGLSCSLGVAIGSGIRFGATFVILYSVAFGLAYTLSLLRFFLWLPELFWIVIIYILSRNGTQVRWLRYLPFHFDEMIILPLPFITQIIVEAYKVNPVAARHTIYFLITSTNQQTVALRAMYDIAVDSLKRCQLMSDIADVANQISWVILPSPPRENVDSIQPLYLFLGVSQDIQASQQATSLYRKYELLNKPINLLHKLQNYLAFEKDAWVATTYGEITVCWLRILETAQCTLEQQALNSQEIRQVYVAGPALDPETAKNRFKGRINLYHEIETLALSDQPPILLLYGGRRTGKTSALKYLPYRVGANIVPLLVDLQGTASATTLKGLAENLAAQIVEAAKRLPKLISLPLPDANQIAQDPFPALQAWLEEIERRIPDKRFLLCLDEFERLSEVVKVTGSHAPLNFLRNIMQHRQKWILLFSGSHQLSELDAYWSDYLINTRALRMSYLQESEARELILQPIEDFPNIYESSAVDTIIQLTRCQPYLVQLVCYELVELLNRDIRANRREANTITATAQDVQEIIPIVLERGDQYFRELWTSLADSDRNLLRRIIQGQTPTPQDKGTVKRLTRKEILNQEDNAFQVGLVQRAIEQFLEEEN